LWAHGRGRKKKRKKTPKLIFRPEGEKKGKKEKT